MIRPGTIAPLMADHRQKITAVDLRIRQIERQIAELQDELKTLRAAKADSEWKVLDKIKRDLETPIEAEMIGIFDDQLREIEANLDNFRSVDGAQIRAGLLSLDSIFDFARWVSETASRLSVWLRNTIFGGYEAGRGQVDVELTDLTSFDPIVREKLDQMARNTRFITETTRDRLAELIERALEEGWSIDRTTDEVQMLFEGMKPHRARTIAVTNTTSGFSAGQMEAFRRAGVRKRWLSQRDTRVRVTHTAADGQERELNDAFEVGEADPMYPADPAIAINNPEEFFNCFVGDTVVYSPNVNRAFRSVFNGELITIVTSRGYKLTGTPNHPILTPDGFVNLGSLSEGMHVLSSDSSDWSLLAEFDVDNKPSPIKQVFDSLDHPWQRSRVGRLSVNFHGDIPDGDVDVVWANRLLRDGVIPEFLHPLYKVCFMLPHAAKIVFESLRHLALDLVKPLRRLVAYGFMGRPGKSHPFIGISLRHTFKHRFTAISSGNTSFFEPAGHYRTGNVEIMGKGLHARPFIVPSGESVGVYLSSAGSKLDTSVLQSTMYDLVRNTEFDSDILDRFPVEITPDEIISIDREHNSTCFVYTLETHEGIYLAGGIVSSNCRCTMLPVR